MVLDDACRHAALEARDRRFDGVFFTGVTSTGVYCRCVCPARTPKRQNRRFFASAAAAEGGGFRPCLVCRPEAAPGVAPIDAGDRLAARALLAIEGGALEEQGITAFARGLGVSDRHLRRVVITAYGASPVALAQTHRLLTAKRLLRETGLTMTQVAFASGFASVRRFNALFTRRYGMAPSRVRGRADWQSRSGHVINLHIAARGGFDARGSVGFLGARAIEGVERVCGQDYERVLTMGDGANIHIGVTLADGGCTLHCSPQSIGRVRALIVVVRRAFDLDTDIGAVDAHLSRDSLLADDVAREPGVRLTCGFDPFEIAVRAVLGQQVSLAAGRALCGKLALACAREAAPAERGLRAFPQPAHVLALGVEAIARLGMPRARAQTLIALAATVARDREFFETGADALDVLGAIKGIGPWTLSYIALRGLGEQDAFPSGDAALQAATQMDARALEAASQAWRPYRGYAALRLWRRAAQRNRSAA